MNWDSVKMAQMFLRKANAIHPEDADNERGRVEAMARQDLFYDCYMSSFSREQLQKRLQEVVNGKFDLPDEEVDAEQYRETYIREARAAINSIEEGKAQ